MKILVCLYIQQSMTIGLFQIILPTMMVERKFSMTEISGFSLMGYLYMLKFFFGPVVDLFYIKQLGRRRSYIIPISIVLSMLLMAIGDIFSNIHKSFIIGCAIYFIISLQDLAIDAYSAQYSKDAFKFQLIGCNIGNTICLLFNMFNQYEIVTLNHFVYTIAFIHAIQAVYCANYLEELPYIDSDDKFRQLRIILGSVFKSKNLKELLVLCFFERSGLCLLDTSFRMNILKFGAQRSHLSILDLALLPMKLSTPKLMKGYLGNLMPFSSYGKFQLFRIGENLIAISTLYFAQQKIIQDLNMYIAVFITLIIWYLNFNAMMIVKNNYLAIIAPKGFEATSSGLINTISYLGTKTISSLTLILLDHFDLFKLLGVGLFCHLVFTCFSYNKYQRLGNLTTNDYYNLQLKQE